MSDLPQLVFVVGSPRSGTTLLASALGRHRRIAATPETHFFTHFLDSRPGRGASREQRVARLLQTHARDCEVPDEELLAEFSRLPNDDRHLFAALMGAFARRQGKPIVAEKTPNHLWRVPEIRRWFPEARFIGIVRDGRDVVTSLMRVDWTHGDLRRHCMDWRRDAALCRRLASEAPGHFLTVRFEDLVSDPVGTTSRVMAFLGLEFEPRQLDPAAEVPTVPAWESEWKQQSLAAPDAGKVARWKAEPPDRDSLITMVTAMSGELARWGYDAADPGPVGLARLARERGANALYALISHPGLRPLRRWVSRHLVPGRSNPWAPRDAPRGGTASKARR